MTAFSGIATAMAAPHASLASQIRQQFPLAANLVGAGGGSLHAMTNAAVDRDRSERTPLAGRFEATRYSDPYRLAGGSDSVMLRPVSQHTAGEADGEGTAYVDAFRHVDALRSQANGVRQEIVVIHDAASKAIEIEVARSTNVGLVAPFENGVRFLPNRPGGEQLAISRPLVVDAEGKPSLRARWDVVNIGGATRIRLHIEDNGLTYPLFVAWSPGTANAADGWSQSALRSISSATLQPRTNGTGSISGRVTDAGTGLGLAGQFVYLFTAGPTFVTSATTDSNGNYTASGLNAGTYYAETAVDGYSQQIYNGINCTTCNVTSGTAITVGNGATTGINFNLTYLSARIAGTVTGNGGAALASVIVAVYNTSDNEVGIGFTDAGGHYFAPVPSSGTYYARTFNFVYSGYVDQVYNGIDCASCDPARSGTPIFVSSGATVNGVNFALRSTAGLISGTVTSGGNPVVGAAVAVYDASGNFITTGVSDNSGAYTTFNGLTSGTYYAIATANSFVAQIYNGIDCPATCDPLTGTAISVTSGQTTTANFSLHAALGQMSGSVTDATTHAALAGVQINVYNSSLALATLGVTGQDGTWSVTLPPGTYYALTFNNVYPGYLDQLYSNIDCTACLPNGGTPITVQTGANTTGVNFGLHTGGSITAHVIDGATNDPIANPTVIIYDSNAKLLSQGVGDANGNYTSFVALSAGNYYVVAYAAGYNAELYNGQPCNGGCAIPGSGTAIVVSTGQNTSFNFPLASSVARIRGSVVAASDSSPLGGIGIQVYDGSNNLVAATVADTDGTYEVSLGASGTYYARTLNSLYPQFGDQLYNHIDCSSGCVPSSGTGISATIGSVTSNINFALTSPGCSGLDVSPSTIPNAPVQSFYTQTFTAVGGTASSWSSSGDLPPGLTLNSSSGVLSGTLTQAGDFNFVISFHTSTGCTAGRSYTMTVTATPTTTTLTANPTSGVFGTSIVLTATVSPSTATGTVKFTENVQTFGSLLAGDQVVPPTSSSAIGQSTFTLDPTHTLLGVSISVSGLSGAPTDAHIHKAAVGVNGPVVVDLNGSVDFVFDQVNQIYTLNQTFTITKALGDDLVAEPFAYYVDVHTAQFPNGEIRGQLGNTGASSTLVLGTATLAGGTASITVTPFVGVHTITATYTGAPTFLASESDPVAVTITKATPTINWANPANITYGTPLSSTQLNAVAVNPVTAATVAGTYVYNPAAGTILNAGTQTLSVAFTPTDTADYTNASKSVTLTVLKATPVFSNLSAPTIILHTASTTISGKLSFGSFIPTGSVSITLNGVTQTAAINSADGTFSTTFDTSTLAVGTYTITFSYAGDANFNSTSATSTLIDAYNFTGGAIPPVTTINGQRALPIKIQLTDVNGVNVSSSSITVTAYGVQLVGSTNWLPAPNVDDTFKFQNSNDGTYMFNLKVTGLASGNYLFGFTAGNDPTIHTVPFTIN